MQFAIYLNYFVNPIAFYKTDSRRYLLLEFGQYLSLYTNIYINIW